MNSLYAATRAKVKKGYLITKEILEGLIEQKTINDALDILKSTDYKKEIAEIPPDFRLIDIEHALRRNLIRHFTEIIIASNYSPIILAYFYKYLLHNLKVVLKGKALKKTYSELYNSIILDAEAFLGRRDIIIKVLEEATLEDAVSTLSKYEFGKTIQEAYNLYREKKNLNIFDIYFDKLFINNLVSSLNKINLQDARACRDIVGTEIDFYNILAILRAKYLGLDITFQREVIIPKVFFISEEILNSLIASEEIENCFQILKSTKYSQLITEEVKTREDLPRLEKQFKIYLYKISQSKFLTGSNNLDVVIAFIKLKEIEVQNLITIMFGIKNGIKPSEIYKLLIL
jgi:V/A-type H+-transporting ATPase subunit C